MPKKTKQIKQAKAQAHKSEQKAVSAAKKAVKAATTAKALVGRGAYAFSPHPRVIRGRGDYVDDAISWGANKAGDLVKSGVSWLGSKAKSFFGSLLGAGDYKVGPTPMVNSLFNGAVKGVFATNANAFVLRRRELLAVIQSSSAFQTVTIPINPGLPGTLQWGSQVSAAFQRWKPMGIAIEYVSAVAPYGGGDVNGSVCLSAQYDVNTAAPATLVECENTSGSVIGRPTDNLIMGVECAPGEKPVNVLEIRTGTLPAGATQQMFDHCNVFISNVGQADTSNEIGRVYILYEIQLELPIDTDAAGDQLLSDHYYMVGVTSAANNGDGTATAPVAGSTLGGKIPTGGGYNFPLFVNSGIWLMSWTYASASTSTTSSPTLTLTNATQLSVFSSSALPDQDGAGICPQGSLAGCTMQNVIVLLSVTGSPCVAKMSAMTFTGATKCDLMVTQFAGTVLTRHRTRRLRALWDAEDLRRQELQGLLNGYAAQFVECNRRLNDDDEKKEDPPGQLRRTIAVNVDEFSSRARILRDEVESLRERNEILKKSLQKALDAASDTDCSMVGMPDEEMTQSQIDVVASKIAK